MSRMEALGRISYNDESRQKRSISFMIPFYNSMCLFRSGSRRYILSITFWFHPAYKKTVGNSKRVEYNIKSEKGFWVHWREMWMKEKVNVKDCPNTNFKLGHVGKLNLTAFSFACLLESKPDCTAPRHHFRFVTSTAPNSLWLNMAETI